MTKYIGSLALLYKLEEFRKDIIQLPKTKEASYLLIHTVFLPILKGFILNEQQNIEIPGEIKINDLSLINP